MRNIWLVAKREYLEQVRGRAFKMTTFGVPAIFAVLIGVGYLSNLGLGSGRHLAVASNDSLLANEIKSQLLGDKDAKAKVDIVSPASSADHDTLVSKVRDKKIDGFLWVEAPLDRHPPRPIHPLHPAILSRAQGSTTPSIMPSSMPGSLQADCLTMTPTNSSMAYICRPTR